QKESNRKTEHKTNDNASSQDKINSELKLTQEAITCKRILELDKSIRYAGMCASDGTLVASEYKKEITPLIDGTELEFAAKLSAIRAMERDVLSTRLGRPMYSIASYENVKRATISLDEGMFLLVSFERNADDALIINKVMNELNISYTLSLCELGSRLAQSLQDPLSVIKSLVEISKKRHHDKMNKEISDNFDTIERITLKLSHQIHDVLTFVRASPLQLKHTPLAEILNQTVKEIFVPTTVKINLPKNDMTIKCDINKLQRVFSNLLINAVQAMDYHGTINIRIMDKDNHTVIEVEDTGKGIPENLMDKIFEPLFTTKEYGTGLGLKTCKNIIEQHKGKITFRNNPTIFTVMLPK
ncbi:MAG: HAMP domain-containing sensor histidine kinase, partial [Nitrosopumilaceae archaeon]|nr:HAMP domain-containing sensor histidine kinase [Nitrosopumilaceae archaeon]